MVKRLLVGFAKGLAVGAVLGGVFQIALGWADTGGLLGYLLAMGAGATTGVVCGKPPWREGVWVEAVLKSLVGVGLGALVFWAASTWAAFGVPFPIVGAAEGASWTTQSLLYLPAVAAFYGMFVELDNTDEGDAQSTPGAKKNRRSKSKKARVANDFGADLDLEGMVPDAPPAGAKRTAD